MTLIYSKDAFDALPITQTEVESQPCAIMDQTSIVPGDVAYPLERDRNNECEKLQPAENRPEFTFHDLLNNFNLDDILDEE